MKSKKEPTKKEVVSILLTALGLISFGTIFFWLPIIGLPLLFFGGLLTLMAILTIFLKVLK